MEQATSSRSALFLSPSFISIPLSLSDASSASSPAPNRTQLEVTRGPTQYRHASGKRHNVRMHPRKDTDPLPPFGKKRPSPSVVSISDDEGEPVQAGLSRDADLGDRDELDFLSREPHQNAVASGSVARKMKPRNSEPSFEDPFLSQVSCGRAQILHKSLTR